MTRTGEATVQPRARPGGAVPAAAKGVHPAGMHRYAPRGRQLPARLGVPDTATLGRAEHQGAERRAGAAGPVGPAAGVSTLRVADYIRASRETLPAPRDVGHQPPGRYGPAATDIDARYPFLDETGRTEEAIAEAYHDWEMGRLKPDPRASRIFRVLRTFFERVRNMLRGLGFQTWRDVFRRIDRGEVGRRARANSSESAETRLAVGPDDQRRVPIVDATRRFGAMPIAQVRRAALTHGLNNLRGSYTNREQGWTISVARDAIEKATSGGRGREHFEALLVLPQLIENAVIERSRPDRDNNPNIKAMHFMAAAMRLEGAIFHVRLVIKETRQGHKFYDHATILRVDPGSLRGRHVPEGTAGNSRPPGSRISLTELVGTVKPSGSDPESALQRAADARAQAVRENTSEPAKAAMLQRALDALRAPPAADLPFEADLTGFQKWMIHPRTIAAYFPAFTPVWNAGVRRQHGWSRRWSSPRRSPRRSGGSERGRSTSPRSRSSRAGATESRAHWPPTTLRKPGADCQTIPSPRRIEPSIPALAPWNGSLRGHDLPVRSSVARATCWSMT